MTAETETETKTEHTEGSNTVKLKKRKGVNTGTLSGIFERVEMKKSGSFEVWLNTDTARKDTPMKGSAETAFFTSVIFIRVPWPVVDRVGKESFVVGQDVIIPFRTVGVRRVALGNAYDMVELRALDIILN